MIQMYYMKYAGPYLEHHGILGQKKGERHGPPYPLVRDSMGRLKTKVQEKRKAATAAKAAKEKNKNDPDEQKKQLKQDILKHPKKLYEHKDDFTKEEINDIISQIRWDQSVKDVSRSEHDRNVDRLKKIIANTADVTRNVYTILNSFNSIKRMFDGDSGAEKSNSNQDQNQSQGNNSGHKKKPNRNK